MFVFRTLSLSPSVLIVIFCRFGGGAGHPLRFNDTWSFDISTKTWTELQCAGTIPSPRSGHAAVLIDNIMYVFGGETAEGTILGDLAAFNLSSKRIFMFDQMHLFTYNI